MNSRKLMNRCLTATAIAAGLIVNAGAAAQDNRISVELNKLEAVGSACQTYLVLENGLERDLESLRLDLVAFDGDGIIAQRLAVETAPLDAGATQVKVFSFDRLECQSFDRMLLNAVLACESSDRPVEGCRQAVHPSSRAEVPFIQ